MRRLRPVPLVLSLLLAPSLIHCGSTDKGGTKVAGVSAGDYRGLLTGKAETGVLDVNISSSASSSTESLRPSSTSGGSTVTGTIALVDGTAKITLTGSFDAATGTLTLTGTTAAGTYSLTGKSSGTSFQGSYTGPHGSGSFSLLAGASGAVTLYCGSFSGDSSGAWNLAVDSSGNAVGSHCDSDSCGALDGTLSGSNVTLTDSASGVTADGTQSSKTLSGTWQAKGAHGQWTGSRDACGATSVSDNDAGQTLTGAGGSGGAGGDGGTGGVANGAGGTASDGGTGTEPDSGQTVAAPVSIVSGLTDAFDLAADDAFVYFFTSTEIHRCPVSGCTSGTGEAMTAALSVPSGVATSGSALFFTHDFHQIDTCAVSANPGCTASTFLDVGASTYPAQLHVKNQRLYWISEAGSERRLQVCPTSGCSAGYPKTILDSANAPLIAGASISGLAITDTNVFLMNYVGPIYRFSISDPETVDAQSGSQAAGADYASGGMDVAGSSLLWGNTGNGKIETCATPSCAPITDFRTGLGSPAAVSVTAANVFVADRGTSNGSGGTVAGTGAIWAIAR